MKTEPCSPSWCCVDCLVLLANGDTPTDLTETQTAAWLADIARNQGDAEVTLGMLAQFHSCTDDSGNIADECDCESNPFSWSPCGLCGSNLGGERSAFTYWIPVTDSTEGKAS